MDPISVYVVPGWIALHALALAAAWGTRVTAGPRIELAIQVSFLAAMVVVGGVAWACHQRGLWIPSAVTLVVMVLTAVSDFHGQGPPAPASSSSAGR